MLVPDETAGLRDTLVAVFRDVLKQPGAGPEDDFFDLGGDSLAAASLVLTLETLGAELAVSALIDAPTPALLAALIERQGLLRERALVILRQRPGHSCEGGPALFIAPGAGGSVMELVPFARKVDADVPIYGLQPRDADGRPVSLATVEEMAQFYLKVVREVQPNGPYLLGGYSLGGMTALEMAQMLRQAGSEVALLLILDTLTPIEFFRWRGKLLFWLRRARHHAAEARLIGSRDLLPFIALRLQSLARDFRPRVPVEADGPMPTVPGLSADGKAMTAAARLFLRYRPQYFPGMVAFVQSEYAMRGKVHYPDLLWRALAKSFTLYRVSGDHETMLSQYSDEVAAAVSTALRKRSKTKV